MAPRGQVQGHTPANAPGSRPLQLLAPIARQLQGRAPTTAAHCHSAPCNLSPAPGRGRLTCAVGVAGQLQQPAEAGQEGGLEGGRCCAAQVQQQAQGGHMKLPRRLHCQRMLQHACRQLPGWAVRD